MQFWKRLLLTLVVMLLASFVAGLMWEQLLGFSLPSYVGGAIGGLASIPVWEFLKRVGPERVK
ncbi:MAG: hypothetical protein JRH01_13720 [Deltaproteobacteria bacterium]|nr:hypothetical protein [Deltaproteobacteria bacterium]MBW2394948.1 hypothetical protein [Deltaproteobacteria bacterium]